MILKKIGKSLIILLGGTQYQYYKFESACQALAIIFRDHPGARLLVAGRLKWSNNESQDRKVAIELLNKALEIY